MKHAKHLAVWDSDYNGVQAQQWTFTFDEIGKTGAFKMHIVAYY